MNTQRTTTTGRKAHNEEGETMKFWTAIYKHRPSFRADASTQERALEKLNNRTGPGSCVITDEDVAFVERDETTAS